MSEILDTISIPSTLKKQSTLEAYRMVLATIVRHPATWCYAVVWISAVLCLYLTGHASYIRYAVPALLLALLCAFLSIQLTKDAPPEQEKTLSTRSVIGTQLTFLAAIIIFSGLLGLAFHNILLPSTLLPKWFVSSIVFINPVIYFVLPLTLLLLTGAHWSELGLGRGWHSWRVVILFLALLLLFGIAGWLSFFAVTPVAFVPLLRVFIVNALENGFFEEFLFRGALLTRLSVLSSPAWALVISSLVFGLWHIGLTTQNVGGNFLVGIASAIVNQATLGLLFGILFLRTRNLLAPSIVHLIWNVVM